MFYNNIVLFNYNVNNSTNSNRHKKKWDGTHYLAFVSKTSVEKDITLLLNLREKYRELQNSRFRPI